MRRADVPGSLSHMCVLDIENGADHFVLVEGTYRASFFGLTISTLSDREASMAEEDLDACECSGDNMKHIFASPFVAHQWAAIPQPLKKMLHFLSRSVALPCTRRSRLEPLHSTCQAHAFTWRVVAFRFIQSSCARVAHVASMHAS